jgi:hypothetical protein
MAPTRFLGQTTPRRRHNFSDLSIGRLTDFISLETIVSACRRRTNSATVGWQSAICRRLNMVAATERVLNDTVVFTFVSPAGICKRLASVRTYVHAYILPSAAMHRMNDNHPDLSYTLTIPRGPASDAACSSPRSVKRRGRRAAKGISDHPRRRTNRADGLNSSG